MAESPFEIFDVMHEVARGSEKDGDISADDLDRAEKELDKYTHEHVERIDQGLGRKEAELLEV